MAESRSTRVVVTTFSDTSLQRYASTEVEAALAQVDGRANAFIHVPRVDVNLSERIIEHFGLPGALAEQIADAAALELDTSSDQYLFKKFRFIEDRREQAGVEAKNPNILIRGSESDRLTESSGCIVVGDNFVLLFEDKPSPLLAEAIETVLRRERELRERGIEYLLYQLARALFIDNYSTLMRQLLDRLQDLEAPLLDGSTDAKTYREVTRLRRELNPFERSLMHAAQFANTIAAERPRTNTGQKPLAGNLADDCARVDSEFSMLRDRTSELIQTHRDNVDAQMNKTMRALTVLSAMFLPLSFITGFYGMNFPGMPTLGWRGTFPIVLTVMVAIVAGTWAYARRRKWL